MSGAQKNTQSEAVFGAGEVKTRPGYTAFISYSHNNLKAAKRLQRRLERYKIPKSLSRGRAGLGTIFRDQDELPASSGLGDSIKAALRNSENLIVLCSPHAAASRWVSEEIRYFKSLGREEQIFTVILSGMPYAEKNGAAATRECLPKPIRFSLTETGALGAEMAEPLSADFRPQGDGSKVGTLKIISGLLGVGLNDLLQRQLTHTRRRMAGVMVGASLIVAGFASLTVMAMGAQKRAEDRRADAENFVEFILSDLSLELESFGRLDILDVVGEKAIGYYGRLGTKDFNLRASGRHARTLHFMGELQNAMADTARSKTYFDQAYAITLGGLEQDPQNPERVFEHARSAFLISLPLRRAGRLNAELVQLKAYAALCENLVALANGSEKSLKELANAKLNLGRVHLGMGKIELAHADFLAGDELFNRIVANNNSVKNLLGLTENLAWLAESYRLEKNFPLNYKFRKEQTLLLETRLRQSPNDFRLKEGLAYARLGLGNAATDLDRFSEAKRQLGIALAETNAALALEPGREKMRRAKSATLISFMKLAIREDNAVDFQQSRDAHIRLQAEPVTAWVREHKYWDDVLPQVLADLDRQWHAIKSAAQ